MSDGYAKLTLKSGAELMMNTDEAKVLMEKLKVRKEPFWYPVVSYDHGMWHENLVNSVFIEAVQLPPFISSL